MIHVYVGALQNMVARDFNAFVSAHNVVDYESIPVQVVRELPRKNIHAEKYESNMLSALVDLDYVYDCVDPYSDEPVDFPQALTTLEEVRQDLFRAAMFARNAGGMEREADAAYLYGQCVEAAHTEIGGRV